MRSRLLEVWLLTSIKSSSKHISTANCDSSLTAFVEALLPKLRLMFSRLFRHAEKIMMLSLKKTRLLLSTTEWLYTLEVLRDEIGNSVHSRNLPVQRNIRCYEERPGIGEGMGRLPFIVGLVHTKEAGNWSQMVLGTCFNMIRIMVIHRTMLCRPRSTFLDSLARNSGMRVILQNSLIRVFAHRTSI